MTRHEKEYRRIARKLSRSTLMEMSAEDLGLEPESFLGGEALVGDDAERRGRRRFLDFYGDEGLSHAFDAYGLWPLLEERGYSGFSFETHIRDERHTLLINGCHDSLEAPARLVELVVRRDRLVPAELPDLDGEYTVLTIDWLMMQDPLATFAEKRPRLPGQMAPGLGLAERVLEMLYVVTERLDFDGVLTCGEYFHNAVLYRGELSYLDPLAAGVCIALEDALLAREGLNLAEASWAVEWGLVSHRETGQPFQWRGEAQVRGMHPDLTAYLRDEARRRESLAEAARLSFVLDRPGLEKRLREASASTASKG